MTQEKPKPAEDRARAGPARAARRIAASLAGGVCAFAFSLPLIDQDAVAQDWRITKKYTKDGWTTTIRRLRPPFGGIVDLEQGPAPGNNCRVLAFEVLNPKSGEVRCVGFVAPAWDP